MSLSPIYVYVKMDILLSSNFVETFALIQFLWHLPFATKNSAQNKVLIFYDANVIRYILITLNPPASKTHTYDNDGPFVTI